MAETTNKNNENLNEPNAEINVVDHDETTDGVHVEAVVIIANESHIPPPTPPTPPPAAAAAPAATAAAAVIELEQLVENTSNNNHEETSKVEQQIKSQNNKELKRCPDKFCSLMEKHVARNERLSEREAALRKRLETLECWIPAVTLMKMLEGEIDKSSICHLIDEQSRALTISTSNSHLNTTLSRHEDSRVRTIEAERKEAHRRLEEARKLLREKQSAVDECARQIEEAQRKHISLEEKIGQFEEQFRRDGIDLAQLSSTDSIASFGPDDLAYITKLEELAAAEIEMKRQVKEMEKKEKAYMNTLRVAEKMLPKKKSAEVDELHKQLNIKSTANQQMADRIVFLEDQVENLKDKLARCVNHIDQLTAANKKQAPILTNNTGDKATMTQQRIVAFRAGNNDTVGRNDQGVSASVRVDSQETLARVETTERSVQGRTAENIRNNEDQSLRMYDIIDDIILQRPSNNIDTSVFSNSSRNITNNLRTLPPINEIPTVNESMIVNPPSLTGENRTNLSDFSGHNESERLQDQQGVTFVSDRSELSHDNENQSGSMSRNNISNLPQTPTRNNPIETGRSREQTQSRSLQQRDNRWATLASRLPDESFNQSRNNTSRSQRTVPGQNRPQFNPPDDAFVSLLSRLPDDSFNQSRNNASRSQRTVPERNRPQFNPPDDAFVSLLSRLPDESTDQFDYNASRLPRSFAGENRPQLNLPDDAFVSLASRLPDDSFNQSRNNASRSQRTVPEQNRPQFNPPDDAFVSLASRLPDESFNQFENNTPRSPRNVIRENIPPPLHPQDNRFVSLASTLHDQSSGQFRNVAQRPLPGPVTNPQLERQSHLAEQIPPDRIELRRIELEMWLTSINDIRRHISRCPTCVSKKRALVLMCKAICYFLQIRLGTCEDDNENGGATTAPIPLRASEYDELPSIDASIGLPIGMSSRIQDDMGSPTTMGYGQHDQLPPVDRSIGPPIGMSSLIQDDMGSPTTMGYGQHDQLPPVDRSIGPPIGMSSRIQDDMGSPTTMGYGQHDQLPPVDRSIGPPIGMSSRIQDDMGSPTTMGYGQHDQLPPVDRSIGPPIGMSSLIQDDMGSPTTMGYGQHDQLPPVDRSIGPPIGMSTRIQDDSRSPGRMGYRQRPIPQRRGITYNHIVDETPDTPTSFRSRQRTTTMSDRNSQFTDSSQYGQVDQLPSVDRSIGPPIGMSSRIQDDSGSPARMGYRTRPVSQRLGVTYNHIIDGTPDASTTSRSRQETTATSDQNQRTIDSTQYMELDPRQLQGIPISSPVGMSTRIQDDSGSPARMGYRTRPVSQRLGVTYNHIIDGTPDASTTSRSRQETTATSDQNERTIDSTQYMELDPRQLQGIPISSPVGMSTRIQDDSGSTARMGYRTRPVSQRLGVTYNHIIDGTPDASTISRSRQETTATSDQNERTIDSTQYMELDPRQLQGIPISSPVGMSTRIQDDSGSTARMGYRTRPVSQRLGVTYNHIIDGTPDASTTSRSRQETIATSDQNERTIDSTQYMELDRLQLQGVPISSSVGMSSRIQNDTRSSGRMGYGQRSIPQRQLDSHAPIIDETLDDSAASRSRQHTTTRSDQDDQLTDSTRYKELPPFTSTSRSRSRRTRPTEESGHGRIADGRYGRDTYVQSPAGEPQSQQINSQSLDETLYRTIGLRNQRRNPGDEMRGHSNERQNYNMSYREQILPKNVSKSRAYESIDYRIPIPTTFSNSQDEAYHETPSLQHDLPDNEFHESRGEIDERRRRKKEKGNTQRSNQRGERSHISDQFISQPQSTAKGIYCERDITGLSPIIRDGNECFNAVDDNHNPRNYPTELVTSIKHGKIEAKNQSKKHRSKNIKIPTSSIDTQANIQNPDVNNKHSSDNDCEVCDCEPCDASSTGQSSSGKTRANASTNFRSSPTKRHRNVPDKLPRPNR